MRKADLINQISEKRGQPRRPIIGKTADGRTY